MIVREWQPGDTDNLVLQPNQGYLRDSIQGIDLAPLSESGMVWTAVDDTGVRGIGGLFPQWDERALAWMLVTCDLKHHFVPLHRAVKKMLIRAPFRRIEATVDVGFAPGHRWMKMLGFEMEGYLRAYRPDGGDQIMYARIRR